MELLKQNFKRVLLFVILIYSYNTIIAQTEGIIIDSETKLPIPFVSIYTRGKEVRGTMGNEQGKYCIYFKYDTIYFSHINYELIKLANHSKIDTIIMNPTIHTMSEIVIAAQDNKWIEKLMTQIVQNKSKNYQTKEAKMSYSFNVKSLSDSSGYAFSSNGYMISPKYSEQENYQICPVSNVIKYKDKTAGKDFMQLRRSVYNNFIKDFDNGFIKKHEFSLTAYINDDNENLLQFSFKSKKGEENTGYIIVDTLKKVITEFEQVAGTNYNIKSNTSSFGRFGASKKGFKYTIWNTVIRGHYSLIDGSYHPTDCRYQLYRQNEYKKGKEKGLFFTNIESQLIMSKIDEEQFDECNRIKLPTPYSIAIIVGKETRLAEEALERVPAEYELF